jgi:hypothetical protein
MVEVVATPTREEIMAAQTPRGGWTRDQLASWGVSWPLPKGWKAALIAKSETQGRR